jgi:GNAT superfamily N-acetyltransferase
MGLLDEVAVGVALGRIEEVGDATIGVIDGLYVEPDARGVGVGHTMLVDLTTWFEQSRCRGVDAAALPGDRATKSFFEAAGYRARLITMHHDLV